jgi:hypothetical protein
MKHFVWATMLLGLIAGSIIAISQPTRVKADDEPSNRTIYLPLVFGNPESISGEYIVIGWNDLGMHCYDLDYSTLSVLPPYNTLWAQVVKRGDPPQIITTGLRLVYQFPENTRSDNKTNFWQYSNKLFPGSNLPPNIGLKGKGLSGEMDVSGDHFIAEGIPLTEFSDSSPNTPDYYQLARLTVLDARNALTLTQTTIVAPVSSEMRCNVCHTKPSTNFRMNILLKHDEEEKTQLAQQAQSGTPVLCSNCHADPALGKPGNPNLPSLSAAMHKKHAEEFPKDPYQQNCYLCHPGPNTKCLRDVMSTQYNMTCVDCHTGGLQALGDKKRTPWIDEPRCGTCHGNRYAEQANTLYRFSKGHGGMYCESCHNSTHAILTSREMKDNLQSIALQGYAGTISKCTVCHTQIPASGGPHH